VAALATAPVVLARRRQVLWVSLTAAVCAGAIGIVVWSGMGKRVTDRLGTLLDEKILKHGLLGLWQDSLHAVPDFWRTGTGFDRVAPGGCPPRAPTDPNVRN